MSAVCASGHTSKADDYCDVCGMPIAASAGDGPAAGSPPPHHVPTQAPTTPLPEQPCPHCGAENVAEALFCEACGYDFTTGTMPRADDAADDQAAGDEAETPGGAEDEAAPDAAPAAPDAATAAPDAATAAPAADEPAALTWVAEVWVDPAWYAEQESTDPLPSAGLPTVVPLRARSVLVGRVSRSRGIHPDIDCDPDTGASRRQAQLTTDGTRWWVEDLDSANGTFVGDASGPLPSDPIPVGQKHELDAGDRIYLGAWTRLVVRKATEDEAATLT